MGRSALVIKPGLDCILEHPLRFELDHITLSNLSAAELDTMACSIKELRVWKKTRPMDGTSRGLLPPLYICRAKQPLMRATKPRRSLHHDRLMALQVASMQRHYLKCVVWSSLPFSREIVLW